MSILRILQLLLLIGFQGNDLLGRNNVIVVILLVLGSSYCILFGLNNNLTMKVGSFFAPNWWLSGLIKV